MADAGAAAAAMTESTVTHREAVYALLTSKDRLRSKWYQQ